MFSLYLKTVVEGIFLLKTPVTQKKRKCKPSFKSFFSALEIFFLYVALLELATGILADRYQENIFLL